MNELLNKLYNEMYSPKITPFELVENAKLKNYHYVNIYSKDGFLWVESSCDIGFDEKAIFYYKFDDDNHLLTLTSVIDDETTTEYDREKEIKRLKSKLYKLLPRKAAVV